MYVSIVLKNVCFVLLHETQSKRLGTRFDAVFFVDFL